MARPINKPGSQETWSPDTQLTGMMGCFYFGGPRRTWAWETSPHVQSLDISSLLKGLALISHFLNTGHRAVMWHSTKLGVPGMSRSWKEKIYFT